MGAEFPEITIRRDFMLANILERLGCLLSGLGIPDTASDITSLRLDYLDELYHFALAKAADMKEAYDNPDGG